MIPWEELDRAPIPGSEETLLLSRRGGEYSIRIGSVELMNSRAHFSEEELARLCCERLHSAAPRILIGGLGMGFTLAAALKCLGPEATIVVGELVPGVEKWNHEFYGHLAGHPLNDKRVTVVIDDIAAIIRNTKTPFDAIILDVDNGPEALTAEENNRLYRPEGLREIRNALTSGGVLGVWSSIPSPPFTLRLQKLGYRVDVVSSRARKGQGGRHTLWFARR